MIGIKIVSVLRVHTSFGLGDPRENTPCLVLDRHSKAHFHGRRDRPWARPHCDGLALLSVSRRTTPRVRSRPPRKNAPAGGPPRYRAGPADKVRHTMFREHEDEQLRRYAKRQAKHERRFFRGRRRQAPLVRQARWLAGRGRTLPQARSANGAGDRDRRGRGQPLEATANKNSFFVESSG